MTEPALKIDPANFAGAAAFVRTESALASAYASLIDAMATLSADDAIAALTSEASDLIVAARLKLEAVHVEVSAR